MGKKLNYMFWEFLLKIGMYLHVKIRGQHKKLSNLVPYCAKRADPKKWSVETDGHRWAVRQKPMKFWN
jgi:hypothetical protein